MPAADPSVLNLLVLGVSGATGVLVTLVFRRLDSVARDVKDIGDKVGKHAERLAEGKAEMAALRRELDETKKKVDGIAVEGCARACPR